MSMTQTNKKCKSRFFYFLIKNGLLNKTVRGIRRLACMERSLNGPTSFNQVFTVPSQLIIAVPEPVDLIDMWEIKSRLSNIRISFVRYAKNY